MADLINPLFQWIGQLHKPQIYLITFVIFLGLAIELMTLIVMHIKNAARVNRSFEETMLSIETSMSNSGILNPLRQEAIYAAESEPRPGQLMERLNYSREKISAKVVPLDINVNDSESVQQSIEALSNKYFLESATITSDDGLVIASSSDRSEEEAAEFSFMFQEAQKIRQTNLISLAEIGVYICSINSRESPLICILKSEYVIESNRLNKIREDAESIIKRWVLKSESVA